MSGRVEARVTALGLALPPPFAPVASYLPYVISGSLLQISGQGPVWGEEIRFRGKLGRDLDLAQGREAAALTALNLLSQARAALDGDLDRVTRCVKIFALVNCVAGFTAPHQVVDAASEMMVNVLGEAGRHARAVVGAPGLPLGIAVELDAVFEIA